MSNSTVVRTPYVPYGEGVYRRELRARLQPGLAVGELIDDFHHFRAFVSHEAGVITGVRAEAPRHPWTTCPDSAARFEDLVGRPLVPTMREAASLTQPKLHCTHLLDAACLAVARAGREKGDVTYRVAVPDRQHGRMSPTLHRDGEALLAWTLDGFEVVTPEPYAGRSVLAGFADWATGAFDLDHLEAVLILQRACVIAGGRGIDIEAVPRADRGDPAPHGACHSYQPGISKQAHRMVGSVRNLTHVTDLEAASLAPHEASDPD